MFLRVSSPKVSYFKPQVGFLASHESDITFTIYNRVQIHNLNKKKLKIIYSIKKKRNKPKFSSSSTQKCQTLGRSPNLRTKRVCLDNIINDLICGTLSFATYITMKSYKEPKKLQKLWVLNEYNAFLIGWRHLELILTCLGAQTWSLVVEFEIWMSYRSILNS